MRGLLYSSRVLRTCAGFNCIELDWCEPKDMTQKEMKISVWRQCLFSCKGLRNYHHWDWASCSNSRKVGSNQKKSVTGLFPLFLVLSASRPPGYEQLCSTTVSKPWCCDSSQAKNQLSQVTMMSNLHNYEKKKIIQTVRTFLPLSWFSQVSCYSDGKLTLTHLPSHRTHSLHIVPFFYFISHTKIWN